MVYGFFCFGGLSRVERMWYMVLKITPVKTRNYHSLGKRQMCLLNHVKIVFTFNLTTLCMHVS
jgi:hypothetical protein